MNMGVAMVPQVNTAAPLTWGSFWMYAVPKNSKNSEAAWNFINYISSEEQELVKFNASSSYRAYGAPFSNVSLMNEVQSSSVSQYLTPVLMSGPYAKSNIFTSRSGNGTEVSALKGAINAVINPNSQQRLSPQDALSKVKLEIAQ